MRTFNAWAAHSVAWTLTVFICSAAETCTRFDSVTTRTVIRFNNIDYSVLERIDQSVAISCSQPPFPRNMQLTDCLLVKTNVTALVGSTMLRNVYALDGGVPSDSTANPDSTISTYRYMPNKVLYSEPLVLAKGDLISGNCVSTNCWAAPISHSRYYLIGHYDYFGNPPFPSFYESVGPFAKYVSGDHYVGLRLIVDGETYYGWSKADGLRARMAFLRPWVYNPEPGAPIQAGMEPVPVTKFRYLAQSVEISWHPAWGDDWKLEASPSLATNATWSAVTSVVSNRVEMATIGSQRFFRLRKSEP